MPIPPFNIDGVIPPFVSGRGPGDSGQYMSPYAASPIEVVERFGNSVRRREILRGWLWHRSELRAHGVVDGFQWLDGSFVELKDPNDLDIVTFFHRPTAAATALLMEALMRGSPSTFYRSEIKRTHSLDAQFVDLNATAESIVDLTRYWAGLFAHRRDDFVWKGMLKVDLDEKDDHAASLMLEIDT